MSSSHSNIRPEPDADLIRIADYVIDTTIDSEEAYETARHVLMDALGCATLALNYPACTRLLGPAVQGTTVPYGTPVPGTAWKLDPVKAAFDIGTLIRWLDFNDTWLAAEWGHPSDNLGGILAVADHLTRSGKATLSVRDVLTASIKAHEIQGVLALENSFNRHGLDHVILVRIATTAVVTAMLGGTHSEVINAVSNAWADGGALRVYRHAPNTGSRKSWAAGDATSRGVRLAMMAVDGEMGYPSALSAKEWGFYDVLFGGQAFRWGRSLGSYVMEHVLFKISYPAEFHAQTAVECAIQLHDQVKHRLGEIERVTIWTHESAMRIINKTGPLHNPADRDHCLQYMTAIALLFGQLTADDYEDERAGDQRIDALRERIDVLEDSAYSRDYLDPDKRAIANALQVNFKDGTSTDKIIVEYPLGHRRRRQEGLPKLLEKFETNLSTHYDKQRGDRIVKVFTDHARLLSLPPSDLMDLFAG